MSNYVPTQAAKAREFLIPTKSKAAYDKVYEDFQKWKGKNLVNGVDDNILLAFFEDLFTAMPVRNLPSYLQKIAEDELHEKPNQVQADICYIKEWIAQQPHLNARTDDQWILTYLRGCKFRLEVTKKKIDYYYSMRSISPQLLTNRDPLLPEIQEILEKKIIVPLKSNEGEPRCFMIRLGIENIDHISLMNITKTILMILDISLNEDDDMITGQNLIFDFKALSLARITELTLEQIKNVASLEIALPVRIKSIIGINAPLAVSTFVEILKPLLSKKLASRLHVYYNDDLRVLQKIIPVSMLPKEYGGDESVNKIGAYWIQKMASYREWFLKDAIYGIDETKRIDKELDMKLFGVDGSFRKLELD